jgi:hypothetical protein
MKYAMTALHLGNKAWIVFHLPPCLHQPMEGEHNPLLPSGIATAYRFTHCNFVDPTPRMREFVEFVDAHGRHAEATLLVERHKPLGVKAVECFPNRTPSGPIALAQLFDPKLRARRKHAANDFGP